MNKISKNIKKLRSEKGFTQDALAEKLHVTRQAISSWETGRTQPDAQMLIGLSEIFSVPIEMLIYGEKRNTEIEEGEKTYMSTATVIVAVLGSVLVAGGIGLIFTALWQELPIAFKAVFAFVPMLLGQTFAFYVIKKKRESISFCEGSAVLWSAGVIITLALINSIFSIHLGYFNCLFLDALMILPMMFLLDAVSPLAVYFYMVIHWAFETMAHDSPGYSLIVFIGCLILVSVGILFVKIKKEKLGDIRFLYSQWISVAAAIALSVLMVFYLSFDDMFTLLAAALTIFILDKEEKLLSPFFVVGTAGSICCSVLTCFIYLDDISPTFYTRKPIMIFIGFAVFIVAMALAFLKNGAALLGNKLKLLEVTAFGSILLTVIINYLCQLLTSPSLSGFVASVSTYVIFFLAFASGVIFIFHGAKENRLFLTNTGFLADGCLIYIVLKEFDTNLIVTGFSLLLLGIILLGINLVISKRKKEAEIK